MQHAPTKLAQPPQLVEFTRRTPAPEPLARLLARAADRFPERPHLTFQDRTWTFCETQNLAVRLGAGLQALEVIAGDRVGICMANLPQYPLACFALWGIGAAGVGMNPLYSPRQLGSIASDSGAKWVIVSDHPAVIGKLRELAAELNFRLIVTRADGSDLAGGAAAATEPGEVALSELLATSPGGDRLEIDPASLAMIQYTGGTTGAPKGAMLDHRNIWYAAHQIRNWLHKIREGREAWYAAAPFSHITGLINYVVEPAIVGGEAILTERFSPRELLDLVRRDRMTILTAIPTMLSAIVAEPDAGELDWSGVIHVLVGGAPVPAELARRFHGLTGLWPQQGYAMTETSGSGVAMPNIALAGHENATGVPMPDMTIEIRSPEDPGRSLPRGEAGEVCFGGPNVIASYWNRPLTDQELTPDGLFRSGDVGYLSEDGVLYVVDRLKDLIICSGYNVYPRNIEEAVLEHSAVAETVALGVPDDYRGETVLAVVTLRAGATLSLPELQDFLRGKLSPIEMPKRLEILDVLPKTENAKLSRHAIRAMFSRPSHASA
ncbi:MAG: long-chain fatty acid--CoA ligase [Phenylobacterium sp.]|uniref:AMP-binding protein n=1 Tax=Phenylobacterium sp. TaxID=1871053 RepID=UPI00122B49E4|nr:AMP-binding protein [Phenylobacterium sp.]TAJ74070.1 MAG: long-chain fatty acid--CoA ligase [Phenylobacterium sp.]